MPGQNVFQDDTGDEYAAKDYNRPVKSARYVESVPCSILKRPKGTYTANDRLIYETWLNEKHWQSEPDAPALTVVNEIDDEPCPPFEFEYVNKPIYGKKVKRPSGTLLKGCKDALEGKSCNIVSPARCSCSYKAWQWNKVASGFKPIIAYNVNGTLRVNPSAVFECSYKCSSGPQSINRVVRRGRTIPLQIFKTRKTGWGLRTPIRLDKGTFIGCYSGEIITHKEMKAREMVQELTIRRNYIFEIDFHHIGETLRLTSERKEKKGDCHARYAIDGFFYGNVTRFINHSCDANMWAVPVYIDNDDVELPLVAFFTCRDVVEKEELTIRYSGADFGDDPVDPGHARVLSMTTQSCEGTSHSQSLFSNECRCGSARCTGFMYKVD